MFNLCKLYARVNVKHGFADSDKNTEFRILRFYVSIHAENLFGKPYRLPENSFTKSILPQKAQLLHLHT